MRMRMRSQSKWHRGALLLLAPALVFALSASRAAGETHKKLDLRSVELGLRTLDGAPTKLTTHMGKKLTLLNLWATWCGPCREELPALARLHRQYRAQGFAVIGLDIDEAAGTVKKFLARQKLGYPMLLSTENKTVAALGDLEALPTSLLLDERGEVLEVLVGAIEVPDLTASIESGLSRPSRK